MLKFKPYGSEIYASTDQTETDQRKYINSSVTMVLSSSQLLRAVAATCGFFYRWLGRDAAMKRHRLIAMAADSHKQNYIFKVLKAERIWTCE